MNVSNLMVFCCNFKFFIVGVLGCDVMWFYSVYFEMWNASWCSLNEGWNFGAPRHRRPQLFWLPFLKRQAKVCAIWGDFPSSSHYLGAPDGPFFSKNNMWRPPYDIMWAPLNLGDSDHTSGRSFSLAGIRYNFIFCALRLVTERRPQIWLPPPGFFPVYGPARVGMV